MKKILFLLFLILLLSPCIVFAHSEVYDFFDFENYVGNDETLKVVPTAGTYGGWGINNPVGPSGLRDGVTSAQTEKGTSMVLVRKNANYPGIYYSLKSDYHSTDSLHISFSIKISGTLEQGSAIFRFRKPNNSTPYNVMTFSDSGYVTFYGTKYRKDGITYRYKKDKWYYVDAIYDVKTGYTKINLTDGEGFNIDYEGMSGFEDALTPVQLVMIETTGYITNGYEGRIYLDDWLVESIPRTFVTNKVHTFEDFKFSQNGTRVSESHMLTGFVGKTNDDGGFAGVFKDSMSESDTSLALTMNTNTPLTLWGYFNNKIKPSGVFETDFRLCNSIADTNILLGDSSAYAKAISIEKQSGKLHVFGKHVGITITPLKDYHISLGFDLSTNYGFVTVSDGASEETKYFTIPNTEFECVNSYKLTFENYQPHGQAQMKAIFDNISLKGRKNIYVSHFESCGNDEVLLESQNPKTLVHKIPDGFTGAYAFGYSLLADADSGNVNFVLSGDDDETVMTVNMTSSLIFAGDENTAAYDKTLPIDFVAMINNGTVTITASQNKILLLQKELTFDSGLKFKSSHLELDAQTGEARVTKLWGSVMNNFDISEAFISSPNEITLCLSNPIDTETAFLAYVNKKAVPCEIVDPYTIKVYCSSDAHANISLKNIRDIFGNIQILDAEVEGTGTDERFSISKPLFFAEQSGMQQEVNEILPGSEITAIINIKKQIIKSFKEE